MIRTALAGKKNDRNSTCEEKKMTGKALAGEKEKCKGKLKQKKMNSTVS